MLMIYVEGGETIDCKTNAIEDIKELANNLALNNQKKVFIMKVKGIVEAKPIYTDMEDELPIKIESALTDDKSGVASTPVTLETKQTNKPKSVLAVEKEKEKALKSVQLDSVETAIENIKACKTPEQLTELSTKYNRTIYTSNLDYCNAFDNKTYEFNLEILEKMHNELDLKKPKTKDDIKKIANLEMYKVLEMTELKDNYLDLIKSAELKLDVEEARKVLLTSTSPDHVQEIVSQYSDDIKNDDDFKKYVEERMQMHGIMEFCATPPSPTLFPDESEDNEPDLPPSDKTPQERADIAFGNAKNYPALNSLKDGWLKKYPGEKWVNDIYLKHVGRLQEIELNSKDLSKNPSIDQSLSPI